MYTNIFYNFHNYSMLFLKVYVKKCNRTWKTEDFSKYQTDVPL